MVAPCNPSQTGCQPACDRRCRFSRSGGGLERIRSSRPLRDNGQLDGSAARSPDQRGGASPRPCSAGAARRPARTDPRIGRSPDSRIGAPSSDAPFWLEDCRCQPPDKGWGVRSEMDSLYLANQTAAFSSLSGSIRSQLTSRFSSVSTLCTFGVRPSLRRPSSNSACFTRLRIAYADGSNSRPSVSGLRPTPTIPTISARNSGEYRRPPLPAMAHLHGGPNKTESVPPRQFQSQQVYVLTRDTPLAPTRTSRPAP